EAEPLEEALLVLVDRVGLDVTALHDRAEDVGHPAGPGQVAGRQALERRLGQRLERVDPLLGVIQHDVLVAQQEPGGVVRGERPRHAGDLDRAGEAQQRRQPDGVDGDHPVHRAAAGLRVEVGHHPADAREVRRHGHVAPRPGRFEPGPALEVVPGLRDRPLRPGRAALLELGSPAEAGHVALAVHGHQLGEVADQAGAAPSLAGVTNATSQRASPSPPNMAGTTSVASAASRTSGRAAATSSRTRSNRSATGGSSQGPAASPRSDSAPASTSATSSSGSRRARTRARSRRPPWTVSASTSATTATSVPSRATSAAAEAIASTAEALWPSTGTARAGAAYQAPSCSSASSKASAAAASRRVARSSSPSRAASMPASSSSIPRSTAGRARASASR